ncbi:spore germination protein [Cohnella panacarvi]|uniref:spore germination protein n=1 Tax=Cohnella panacarvi TaxID=400776 RepID=UPI000479177E|nr:spore germination protein [Cohnella panacarvi]
MKPLSLGRTLAMIRETLGRSEDLVVRTIRLEWAKPSPIRAAIVYLDGMVDTNTVQEAIIGALHRYEPATPVYEYKPDLIRTLQEAVLNAGDVQVMDRPEDGIPMVLSGHVLLLAEGMEAGVAIASMGWKERAVSDSTTQPVVKGPQESFTETLRTNTSLIRKRVKDPRVRIVGRKLGTVTNTDVNVLYIEDIAAREIVQEVLKRLENVSLKGIYEGEYIEEFFRESKWTLFPTTYSTDRPDSVAAALVEGRIALCVDGSPFALIVPALFLDFIQSAEDYYQPPLYSNLVRLLRFLALFIATLAPAFYISITTFHQDLFPTQLLLSLASQREGVPFPAFVEALFMEITFEILREAGIRMPRTIGQAVSIVGTIVIGDAAVQAGIVSPIMVIVVSITAISSFVIPSYSLAISARILRFVYMTLAAAFGFVGLFVSLMLTAIGLCRLDSFGVPYMSPEAPFDPQHNKDALFRLPFWFVRKKRKT